MKKNRIDLRFFIVILSGLLGSYPSFAQTAVRFYIQQLDNRNGLSNSAINSLYKDADSLLWVATWDGLNMYDGSSFHVYNYSKENNYKTIGSNVIQQVLEDPAGNIWISTIEGISRFEKNSGKFQNYFYELGHLNSISEKGYQLAVTKTGKVFSLTPQFGLTAHDERADSFRVCSLPRNGSAILRIAFDAADRLWILNSHGELEVYTGDANGFRLQRIYQDKDPVNRFFNVNNKIFYTTAGDALFEIDPVSGIQTKRLQLQAGLSSMLYYQDHYILASAAKGYAVFDQHFLASDFLYSEAAQMRNIKVTSLVKGSEQILWLGTDGNGIIKIYPKSKTFGTVLTAENGNPYNQSVRAFCEENGNLWFGTKGNGIVRINDFWRNNTAPKTRENFLAPKQLDNNAVYSLMKGSDDIIYIGTDGKGIGLYDLKTKSFYRWTAISNHENDTEFGSVYAMLQDSDRSVWMGTSGYGLIHLRIERLATGGMTIALLEKYAFNNNNTGPANDIIYALADGGNNKLWIGCRYGGLSLLDKKTRNFKTFKAFTYEGSLSNNDVLSLYKDSRNRLWVGTSYGLNSIDNAAGATNEPIFQKFTTANGLPNNTIHGITEDSLGHIWASTNRGLIQVDLKSGKISNYQQIDGLQSNEFCDGAVWRDAHSQLFFGGTYGINYFLPQKIRLSDELPNIMVSNIMLSGKAENENSFAVLHPDTHEPFHFSIERKDDFFELEMKALSFLNSEKCEYAWFMEGYDNAWHYSGTSGKITYSNILPGSYTLKVKWSNGEGVWTKELPLLDLNVNQYFWLTGYAFLLYALLACTLACIMYRYSINRRLIQEQLAVEHAMRTREEETHQDRISFFTNIAHELQTPLTLIMGSIELLNEKTSKGAPERSLPLIHQYASKLTYLVHQLMEFRKVESGFFKNQYEYFNLSELLRNLAEPFVALAEQSRMEYEIRISPDLTGWMDKDKLEKIIFNLLSNAFKYAGEHQKVIISASGDSDKQLLQLSVANSGTRLQPEQLHKLFDQFYVTATPASRSDKLGTGIGLAFTRQLVRLLKGHIRVSQQEAWIRFDVELPLAAEGSQLSTEKKSLTAPKPSYLYRSVTSYQPGGQSTTDHNKGAVLETLEPVRRKHILVIEDEPEIRFLLRDLLKGDYIVLEAEDGERAIAIFDRVIPDLIICDVMMPNVNGLELCDKIKNTPATCHIPFIMLSARDTVEQHMEGYEVGADAYIAKPFQTSHLRVRIRKMLEQAERQHQFFKQEQPSSQHAEIELPAADRQFLDKLVKLIEENLDDADFNAEKAERLLCLSKMQLYRKLKTLTGMTPGEFIKNLRLREAAHLLITTRFTVAEIFLRTGFNNQSYFFREFRKRYQVAPNEYRNQQTLHL